jgi:hypothetical protein
MVQARPKPQTRYLATVYGKNFYDDVFDVLQTFLPPSMRDFEWYRTSHNLKLWFGPDQHEHYEVQVFKQGKDIVLEIGFHAEHKEPGQNDEVIARLPEARWRKALGPQAEVGAFIGRQTSWRRVSEIWNNGSHTLGDPELAVDAADRLAAYIRALEPLRR